jgi:hypothetical protein
VTHPHWPYTPTRVDAHLPFVVGVRPTLFVGGQFKGVDGRPSSNLAAWIGCRLVCPGDVDGDGSIGNPNLQAVLDARTQPAASAVSTRPPISTPAAALTTLIYRPFSIIGPCSARRCAFRIDRHALTA